MLVGQGAVMPGTPRACVQERTASWISVSMISVMERKCWMVSLIWPRSSGSPAVRTTRSVTPSIIDWIASKCVTTSCARLGRSASSAALNGPSINPWASSPRTFARWARFAAVGSIGTAKALNGTLASWCCANWFHSPITSAPSSSLTSSRLSNSGNAPPKGWRSR